MDPVESVSPEPSSDYKKGDSRAKDSLAIVGEASEERHDIPGALGVKTRGGLVKEEQEAWLARHMS